MRYSELHTSCIKYFGGAFIVFYDHFGSLKAPGHHSFSFYEKEKCHSAKLFSFFVSHKQELFL